MTIKIVQSNQYEGEDWWSWAVWLEAPKREMDAIKCVVYRLHSTFEEPVRTITTRRNGFKLESGGWGEFVIHLEIVGIDGRRRKRDHSLKLEYPKSAPPKPETKRVAKPVPRRADPKSGGPILKPAIVPPLPRPEPLVKATAAPASAKVNLPGPKIFISNSAADALIARRLRDKLQDRGASVSTIADMAASDDWETSVKDAIQSSDASVFVVSGRPALSSVLEMEFAHSVKARSVPLLVGTETRLPSALADQQVVHIDTETDVDGALDQILGAANVKI